jgi:hypothetical protein
MNDATQLLLVPTHGTSADMLMLLYMVFQIF